LDFSFLPTFACALRNSAERSLWVLLRRPCRTLSQFMRIAGSLIYMVSFLWAFTFAHLARCAAAIFLRADADMARFTGAKLVFVAACDSFRSLAHRAF